MTFLPDVPWMVLIPIALALVGLCVWRFLVEPKRRVAWIRRTLMAIVVIAMVARPGVPGGEVPTGSVNVNVFLLIDTSQSSAAEDWGDSQPRIEGMRDDIQDIAYAFAGADMSVITFDSEPELRAPLTDDGSAIIELVNAIRPEVGAFSQGTSISIARTMLLEQIQRGQEQNPGAPTIVFYLGDGEQTSADAPQSFSESAEFIDSGFVLGYGTADGGRMIESRYDQQEPQYVQDPATGQDAVSRIDEAALQTIADELGISYQHRSADVDIESALQAMTSGQGEVDLSEYREARLDLYWVLAVPLFALLAWELWGFAATLGNTIPRKVRR